jgi:hypothetical protein
MTHLKTYCFFIYYQRTHLKGEATTMNLDVQFHPILQKLSFKLKDDKNTQYTDQNTDNNKNIQLNFYDLSN